MILSRLATNRDGKVSRPERASMETEPRRELRDRADRNGDVVTTRNELTKESQLRDELQKQLERAIPQRQQSSCRAGQGDEHALRQQLPEEMHSAGADSRASRRLLYLARSRASSRFATLAHEIRSVNRR